MKLAVIALTVKGREIADRLREELKEKYQGIDIYLPAAHIPGRDLTGKQLPGKKIAAKFTGEVKTGDTDFGGIYHRFAIGGADCSLKQLVGNLFENYQGLVFIMALGIVVRVIAPYIQDKRTDPAVVTLDEMGQNVISTLSGHLGGANKLTEQIAALLAASPVITTATDTRGKPAFDLLARKLNCQIIPFANLKYANSALVNDRPLEIITDYQPEKILPESVREEFLNNRNIKLIYTDRGKIGKTGKTGKRMTTGHIRHIEGKSRIENSGSADRDSCKGKNFRVEGNKELTGGLTDRNDKPFTVIISNRKYKLDEYSLQLVPENIVIGVGCRRGIKSVRVEEAVDFALGRLNLRQESIAKLATIDLKKDEKGLIEYAHKMGVELKIISRQDIRNCDFSYTESEFVREKIGVGGVCEPAAMLSVREGRLILGKTIKNGVTIAVAEELFLEMF